MRNTKEMKKNKFTHAIDQCADILSIKNNVRKYILNAQYKLAHKFLVKEYKKYPSSYYIPSMLATLNTENAFCMPEKKKDKLFGLAARNLRVLLYSVNGASKALKTRNINEYYWFSQQHKKQYLFGIKTVEGGDIWGLYSQGVGASNYAYKLFSQNKCGLGLKWAVKAEKIWEEFFEKCTRDYYDPWCWYALSLGLQGKEKDMDSALKKSSKLSKKDLKSYPLFIKIRTMAKESD